MYVGPTYVWRVGLQVRIVGWLCVLRASVHMYVRTCVYFQGSWYMAMVMDVTDWWTYYPLVLYQGMGLGRIIYHIQQRSYFICRPTSTITVHHLAPAPFLLQITILAFGHEGIFVLHVRGPTYRATPFHLRCPPKKTHRIFVVSTNPDAVLLAFTYSSKE